MESSKRRSYTAKQREAVVSDVHASGVIAASKKHDVPQSCVSRWANAAGVRREVGEQSAVAVPPLSDVPSPSEPARSDDNASATLAAIPTAKRTLRSRVAKVYTRPRARRGDWPLRRNPG